ncbi:MAG TPA: hypothetical protein VGD37_16560 [Kofleriaceae bacterium]|jgi:hypothetical protein
MTRRWTGLAAIAAVAACWALAGAPRRAAAEPAPAPPGDAVALLPLDAERSLEIYGQPVASEIARALGAGHIAVVVVGPRMAVPDRARLIIDGTIALGKASAVTISLRIRNTFDGRTLETLSATAPSLARIDSAAAELSAHVLPIVRDQLAALHRAAEDHGRVIEGRPPAAPAAPAVDRPLLIAVADAARQQASGPLVGALDAAVASWSRAHHRTVHKLEASQLDPRLAGHTVASAGADLAIGFWILEYRAETGKPPMARARVRVRISDATGVVFDRVVATDTVLGDAGQGPPELAARVAREVLAILGPHLRRSVPAWR